MRKETPARDDPYNPPLGNSAADNHPLEGQLATLRQMTRELEHEIDDILADARELVGSAPGVNRAKVIKALVADKRKKLLRLQSYLVMLEERVNREAIGSH
ncbi:hypothetical protein [Ensifer sp. SSB1]|uniref:hypothetical protein n=1 Tax=Ensifer sp. SSB1 TaxID=2795385 RepID=UPI001A37C640|nr:hypothetical protein [Ensifer sp. SSB1]MBK5566087.1 hypothetical protein [Ensifer sp. SSB1]